MTTTPTQPELILTSARLLEPATGALVPHTALAASGGRVLALGDDREIRALAGPRTEVVDLRGAVVMPGLTDGHMHPVGGVERTQGVHLAACTDVPSLRAALAEYRTTLPAGAWLRGWGLDPNIFGRQEISAATVGAVLDGVPAFLDLFDGHSALASPRALELAGIDGPRTFEQNAEIVCDVDGTPTGLILEDAAYELIEAVAPHLTVEELSALTATKLREMAANGLTGGHVMDACGKTLPVLTRLDELDELPLRFRVAPWYQPDADPELLNDLIRQQGTGGKLWHVAGVKFFMDGTIDNGTAWLEHPDCHGQSTHSFWPDPDDYARIIATLHHAGVPTATHAIGDAAIRHALDAIEAAQVAAGEPGAGTLTGSHPRHRIEHIETVPDATIARFAELGVTASMQPRHCCDYTRADHTDNWSLRLGEERAARAWRCRDLWDSGARVVLGSDWPIAPHPPLATMAAARHRRPSRDLGEPPHGPEQALSPLQALQAMTVHPAWVAGDEDSAGFLNRIGGRADFTVLAENPLDVHDHELAQVPVRLTVLAGRPTFRAADL